ncbi:MAG: FAD-dependent oxidoreductase [Planctomycetota bacterium]
MSRQYDVLIVGGGVIGAACADHLAGEGHRVALFERGPLAREASWAAPGIVHPVHPWKYAEPLPSIFKVAMRAHPPLVEDLIARTGIDPELRRIGLVVRGGAADRIESWWNGEVPVERLHPGPAILLPEACAIRPPRFTRALFEGARRRGAELFDHTEVRAVEPGRVRTDRGEFEAPQVVLAAGAWSGRLRDEAPTVPVRGQVLLFEGELDHMTIYETGDYAVPRPDGQVLFGATLERAGFDARPDEAGFELLARRAAEWAGLDRRRIRAAWSGLRPGTPSDLPYICAHDGLVYATGHYRAGFILAPLTARLVGDLVADRVPEFDFPLPSSGRFLKEIPADAPGKLP